MAAISTTVLFDNTELPTLAGGPASCRVVSMADLGPADFDAWQAIRDSRPDFLPPFFSHRFALAIQHVRGDVLVAVLENGTRPVGFLPFHRTRRWAGRPVGVPVGRFINDAHNVIAGETTPIHWSRLAQSCGVVGFDFHAMAGATPGTIVDHQLSGIKAYRADLGGDSRMFLRRLRRSHRTIDKQGQKTRKLGREIGDVRVEFDCRCPTVLEQAINWKRGQYQRTHILDLFSPQWTRQLIERLHGGEFCETADCQALATTPLRGLLSVLWAGDRVAAAHIGMVERGRLHYWFPTYDPTLAKYSPGTGLFTELLAGATDVGVDCIDMGYGEQPYKQKQTATTTHVACGTITDSSLHRMRFAAETRCAAALKRMPMKATLKRTWRKLFPTAGIGKLS